MNHHATRHASRPFDAVHAWPQNTAPTANPLSTLIVCIRKASKTAGKKASRLGLAGVLALSPYVAGMNKADATSYSETVYVSQGDCTEIEGFIPGESECFSNIRDAVEHLSRMGDDVYHCGQSYNDCQFTIQVGAGEFSDNNIVPIEMWYPTRIVGSGNLETSLINHTFAVYGVGHQLENLSLNGYGPTGYGSETVHFDRNASGTVSDSMLTDAPIALAVPEQGDYLFVGSSVQIERNKFRNSGSKPESVPAIVIRAHGGAKSDEKAEGEGEAVEGEGEPPIEAALRVYDNEFTNLAPAISVSANVSLVYEERPGGNTFIDCDPVVYHSYDVPLALTGDFYIDTTVEGEGEGEGEPEVKGMFIKDADAVRQMDANEILNYYKSLEDYTPAIQGDIYYLPADLIAAGKATGTYADNVEFSDLWILNPLEMHSSGTMTNMEYYLANGDFGTSSLGVRTLDDVDGDGISNLTEIAKRESGDIRFNEYDTNLPGSEYLDGLPASSGLGLAGLLGTIGLAAAYGVRRRAGREEKESQ